MRVCLDCPAPTTTTVCAIHAAERWLRDGPDWFARLRADLWAKYPDGDWDGAGPGKRRGQNERPMAGRKPAKAMEGEPAW